MAKSRILLLAIIVMNSQLVCESAKTPQDQQDLVKGLSEMIGAAFSGFRYCPPPYYHVLGECFYVHQYIPLLNWQDAQDFCKQAGGIGAEPKHFGALIAELYNMGKAKDIFNGDLNNVWMGGRRVGNTSTFEWSSGRPITDPVRGIRIGAGMGAHPGMDPLGTMYYYSDMDEGDCVMMTLSRQVPFALMPNDCEVRAHYACQLP